MPVIVVLLVQRLMPAPAQKFALLRFQQTVDLDLHLLQQVSLQRTLSPFVFRSFFQVFCAKCGLGLRASEVMGLKGADLDWQFL